MTHFVRSNDRRLHSLELESIANALRDFGVRLVGSINLVITNHDPRKVPQGLIHYWVGVMFVPNASLDQVLRVLYDYDRYSDIYKSMIRKASVIERDGDTVKLNVLAVQKAFFDDFFTTFSHKKAAPGSRFRRFKSR